MARSRSRKCGPAFRDRILIRNVSKKGKANCSGGRSRRVTTHITLKGVGGSSNFVRYVFTTGATHRLPRRRMAISSDGPSSDKAIAPSLSLRRVGGASIIRRVVDRTRRGTFGRGT